MSKKNLSLLAAGSACAAYIVGAVAYREKSKRLDELQHLVLKNDKIIQLLNEFLEIKQAGKGLDLYFKENDCQRVAIYGMGYLGRRLYNELQDLGIGIEYIVDKNSENVDEAVPVYRPNQKLPSADIMIVTPAFYFRTIEEELEQCVSCPIVSLEDVLDEVLLSEY